MEMNWVLTIGMLGYNVAIILIVSAWLAYRARTHNIEEDFILSGRNLPWYVIAATNCLTCIGGGHILGLTGQSWNTGTATMWFSISMCGSFLLIMMYVGPWIRRMGFVTTAGMFSEMFGDIVRPLITGVSIAACFGIVTLETQGLGAVVMISTGVPMWFGVIIGGFIGMLYILLAGIKEVGWVNLINAILMYGAVILVLIFLGINLQGGWQPVNDFYVNNHQTFLLTLFGNGDIIRTYVIGTFVSSLFYNPIVQQCAQVSVSAKNSNNIKKAVAMAIILNLMFSAFMVGLGMIARTLPDASAMGDGGPAVLFMMATYLPTWLSIWILGVFIAALLSTWGMLTLASSTHIVKDIMEKYYAKAPFSLKQEGRYTRIVIVIFGIVAIAVSTLLPSVNPAIVWCFSWTTPMFVMFAIGMHYKRSTWGCIVTWVIAWIMNMVLSLTPLMEMMHLEGNNYAIYMLVISVVFGYLFTALDKNAKPSFASEYKKLRAQWDAEKNNVAAQA